VSRHISLTTQVSKELHSREGDKPVASPTHILANVLAPLPFKEQRFIDVSRGDHILNPDLVAGQLAAPE
jgi:hypothetical protein